MAVPKRYFCCICHEELTEYKPIRLIKQLHDNRKPYGAYHNRTNYNFCKRCYRKFDAWIIKHKEDYE